MKHKRYTAETGKCISNKSSEGMVHPKQKSKECDQIGLNALRGHTRSSKSERLLDIMTRRGGIFVQIQWSPICEAIRGEWKLWPY